MDNWYWLVGLALKPLIAFFLLACVALPIRWLVWHKMPECKLKDVLLKNRAGPPDSLTR